MGIININALEHQRQKDGEKQKVQTFFGFHESFSILIFLTGEIPPSEWATSKMELLISRSTGK